MAHAQQPNWRRAIVALFLIVLAAISACGSDDRSYPIDAERLALPSLPPSPDNLTLPPNNQAILADLYGPALHQFGHELTRATLIDGANDYDTAGEHLALYTEPIQSPSPDDYARGLWDLTAFFATDVFERWPELDSFDICQENPDIDQPTPERTVTQVTITRRAARDIDWQRGHLPDLIKRATQDGGDVTVTINRPAEESSLLE